MNAFDELHAIARDRGWRLTLELLGPTGHAAGSIPIYPHGSLAVRVYIGLGDRYGRCQSEPGRETVEELAAGALEVIRRRAAHS